MRLSAPAHKLKQRAKSLARQNHLPLNEALDSVAEQEGFKSWSLLAARLARSASPRMLLDQLSAGDLALIAARPGQGKTAFGLELVLNAVKAGRDGWFFSLEWNMPDVIYRLQKIDPSIDSIPQALSFDSSEKISADYIIDRLANVFAGTIVIIDYLQFLDQDRQKPKLQDQIRDIEKLAKKRGVVFVFISQVDRSYDLSSKKVPDIEDVRLPNPLDLSVFSPRCFIGNLESNISDR